MISEETECESEDKYIVVTVEKTPTPEGIDGDNWFRYVIGYGRSRVEGKKPGTLKTVTAHAEAVADDLNSRALKGISTYTTRQNRK